MKKMLFILLSFVSLVVAADHESSQGVVTPQCALMRGFEAGLRARNLASHSRYYDDESLNRNAKWGEQQGSAIGTLAMPLFSSTSLFNSIFPRFKESLQKKEELCALLDIVRDSYLSVKKRMEERLAIAAFLKNPDLPLPSPQLTTKLYRVCLVFREIEDSKKDFVQIYKQVHKGYADALKSVDNEIGSSIGEDVDKEDWLRINLKRGYDAGYLVGEDVKNRRDNSKFYQSKCGPPSVVLGCFGPDGGEIRDFALPTLEVPYSC